MSDGDTTFSRLPSRSPLVRCPYCPTVFWEDDLQAIGELPKKPLPSEPMGWFLRKLIQWGGDEDGILQTHRNWGAAPPEWRAAAHDRTLEYADLCQALHDLAAPDPARELYIRRGIWWLANDRSRVFISGRRSPLPPLVLHAKAKENML